MSSKVTNLKVLLKALKHLKKKKGLEKILQQRDQAIEKIENLISIIQQTESQKHVGAIFDKFIFIVILMLIMLSKLLWSTCFSEQLPSWN